MSSTRDHLHELVNALPEDLDESSPEAQRLIAEMLSLLGRLGIDTRRYTAQSDPLAQVLLSAPIDDEPDSKAERDAVAEARAEMNGRRASHQSVRRQVEARDEE
ncbi:MAG TPA: hypothetical protein VGL99_01710 [Chloroflexota bacterium]|jgi:hypothetical protein